MLEAAVQQQIRDVAAQSGLLLWRNNVGACIDQTGRVIRYGISNDSANMNARLKSPDLVGIRPMLITQEWVGHVVGVFLGIEAKASDWHRTQGDGRAEAQARFHDLIRGAGGFAGFATSVDDMKGIARL